MCNPVFHSVTWEAEQNTRDTVCLAIKSLVSHSSKKSESKDGKSQTSCNKTL